ncbi:hypothetical protein BBP40_011834 [Aspergillus hancockii]|nr:hypothetical protein BBP40_011834 [Aspergillus hancockii]
MKINTLFLCAFATLAVATDVSMRSRDDMRETYAKLPINATKTTPENPNLKLGAENPSHASTLDQEIRPRPLGYPHKKRDYAAERKCAASLAYTQQYGAPPPANWKVPEDFKYSTKRWICPGTIDKGTSNNESERVYVRLSSREIYPAGRHSGDVNPLHDNVAREFIRPGAVAWSGGGVDERDIQPRDTSDENDHPDSEDHADSGDDDYDDDDDDEEHKEDDKPSVVAPDDQTNTDKGEDGSEKLCRRTCSTHQDCCFGDSCIVNKCVPPFLAPRGVLC